MRFPATLKWIGLALLGILVAAAVAVAASRLVSKQIGLASEPISAGDTLAPVRRAAGPGETPGATTRPQPTTTTVSPPTTTTAAPPTTPRPSGSDHSEGGDGERGGDPDD